MEQKREFITLGQLLKFENIISSGGHAKFFLAENEVFVNDEKEARRGRKLYDGDVIRIEGIGEFEIQLEDEQ